IALENAINAIDAIPTTADKAQLPTAKETAKSNLTQLITDLDLTSNYDDDEIALINGYKTEGDASIEAATTIKLLDAAVETITNKINAVPNKELKQARSDAVDEIEDYAEEKTADLDPTEDADLIDAIDDVVSDAIEELDDAAADAIDDIVSAAKDAIDLLIAKADAVAEINDYAEAKIKDLDEEDQEGAAKIAAINFAVSKAIEDINDAAADAIDGIVSTVKEKIDNPLDE
ncbi:MAG: hypothetical protein LBF68_07070, partial [Christensenellaceae bacterium]|nr:hypothetical protein [Christensenellaceae bacterium]